MLDLPKDVLIFIFTYLGISEAPSLSRTSKGINNFLISSTEVWHSWWKYEGWLLKKGSKVRGGDDSDNENEGEENESEAIKEVMNVDDDEKGEKDWRRFCKVRYEYEYSKVYNMGIAV